MSYIFNENWFGKGKESETMLHYAITNEQRIIQTKSKN